MEIKPGDIVFADEGEKVAAAIPQENLHDVIALLPKLKAADDAVLSDVVSGGDLKKAFGWWSPKCFSSISPRLLTYFFLADHPDHYTHFH